MGCWFPSCWIRFPRWHYGLTQNLTCMRGVHCSETAVFQKGPRECRIDGSFLEPAVMGSKVLKLGYCLGSKTPVGAPPREGSCSPGQQWCQCDHRKSWLGSHRESGGFQLPKVKGLVPIFLGLGVLNYVLSKCIKYRSVKYRYRNVEFFSNLWIVSTDPYVKNPCSWGKSQPNREFPFLVQMKFS